MAQSLVFSAGSFSLATYSDKGTNSLKVKEIEDDTYLLKNSEGTTIKGLTVLGKDSPLALRFKSNDTNTLNNTSVELGKDDDALIISGKTRNNSSFDTQKGKDEFLSGDTFRSSSLTMGKGEDNALFLANESKFVAEDASISMGPGKDTVNFDGNVKDISINLGAGKDVLIFGGNINNAAVNLGSDDKVDVINIAEGAKLKGLTITGASENDILFIGSAEYSYEGNNTWQNVNDPSDIRNF